MKKPAITLVAKTASTNGLAMEALGQGAPQGTAFIADAQMAGRGRRQSAGAHKEWFSPAGQNIYLSVVIRPAVKPEKLSAITLAVGVALVELLRQETGLDIWLKWPNDLYIGARKLGGVLTEGMVGHKGVEGAVVGVGLNVNMGAAELPGELKELATSLLMESEVAYDRLTLALKLVEAIVDVSDIYAEGGLEVFRKRLDKMDRLGGRVAEVDLDGEAQRVVVEGIGERGGLVVRFSDGESKEVLGGEVRVHGLGGISLKGED